MRTHRDTAASLLALGIAGALALPGMASAAPVVNGGFETGDFTGWTVAESGSGQWSVYTGNTPSGGLAVGPPPEGTYAAGTGQSGPGSHILTQDVVLASGQSHVLKLSSYLVNNSGFTTPSPATLDFNGQANQQYRIDVMTPTAAPTSVDPADVLASVYQSQPGDAATQSPTQRTTDLSAFAGQTVKLRFAETDNQGNFSAAVDDVRVDSAPLALATGSPDPLVFGSQPQSTVSATKTVTFAIAGTAGEQLGSLAVVGADADDFWKTSDDCPAVIPVSGDGTCTARVRFIPSAEGARTAQLRFSDDTNSSVALQGTGGALPQGAPGSDGTDGAPGADGTNGAPGADGTNGAPGADGTNGADGAPGTNGTEGIAGPAGGKGSRGKRGRAGRPVSSRVACKVTRRHRGTRTACVFTRRVARSSRVQLRDRRGALATAYGRGTDAMVFITKRRPRGPMFAVVTSERRRVPVNAG